MYDNPYTRLLLDTKMRCEFTSQIQEPTLLGAVGRGPWAMSRGNATDQRVLGQGNSRQVWALIFYTMILSSTYLIEKV